MPFTGIRYLLEPLWRITRNILRARTRPMSMDEAEEKKELMAKLYFLTTFGLFCASTGYFLMNFDKYNEDLSHIVLKNSPAEELKVYVFDGKTLKENYIMRNPAKSNSLNENN